MNLLEALVTIYDTTEHMVQTPTFARARRRMLKKIEQLQAQRARRKPSGELVATVIQLDPGHDNTLN